MVPVVFWGEVVSIAHQRRQKDGHMEGMNRLALLSCLFALVPLKQLELSNWLGFAGQHALE
jgi:hypothetical protein